jgi:hypothetical protein
MVVAGAGKVKVRKGMDGSNNLRTRSYRFF